MSETPLVEVKNLSKYFPLGGGMLMKSRALVRAVDAVSLSVRKGESFGLVGESGCGKTTLGRLIIRLIDPSEGHVIFKGRDITGLNRRELRPLRSKMQIIFQDPYSSLDPRMKVGAIIAEPLMAQQNLTRAARMEIAAGLLNKVGLRAEDLNKYPHEFSGGQRQRIGIARALCVNPEMVVADEPVSALDVSIQAQVINLMEDLKQEFDLSYVFISHDLSVVLHVCDRIAVMYLGSIVETAPAVVFGSAPRHPYSRLLLSAIPLPDPHLKSKPVDMEGDVPSPIDPPPGCPFHPRCPYTMNRCRSEKPELVSLSVDHSVACWLNDSRGLQGGIR